MAIKVTSNHSTQELTSTRYFRKEEIKRQDIEAKKKELRRRLNPAPIGVYSPIVKDAFDMMEKYMKGEKSLTDSSTTTQEEAK